MKLISVNIEGDNHLDLVKDFLSREKADVVCLQETFAADIPVLQATNNYQTVIYAPNVNILKNESDRVHGRGLWGVALFSNLEVISSEKRYYVGTEEEVPTYNHDDKKMNRSLVVARVRSGGQIMTLITTHFTWTPDSLPTPLQLQHFECLKNELSSYQDFVLCGDFNLPRYGELYNDLAATLIDHMPRDLESTIDSKLHRVPSLRRFVDYLFSTPHYRVDNIKAVDGVSDHKAIMAELSCHSALSA